MCFWAITPHKYHIIIKFLHVKVSENPAHFCLISVKKKAMKRSVGMILAYVGFMWRGFYFIFMCFFMFFLFTTKSDDEGSSHRSQKAWRQHWV